MALVRRIMNRHIKDERTIILAVIPSNTDIATQEILSIAKELDPKGLRTIGVLTKPDLVDKGGEENVISLVEGKRNPLRLGYCIVRNRGQSELSNNASERLKKEAEFFATEPWSRLDRDRVGTPALQRRLQELLESITRREFPKVQAQIVQQLATCRNRLDGLGADRESTDQQRRFLLEISHHFQDVTNCALDASYSRHAVFSSVPELRIATLAVQRMERFAADIAALGHTVSFNSAPKEEVARADRLRSLDVEDSDGAYPELSDLILTDRVAHESSNRNIMDWIGEEYRRARGFGLAAIGPSILPTIWQEQAKNWEGLTFAYIADMVFFVHDFTCKALAHVCRDEGVRSGLWYHKTVDHVRFLIEVERFGTPMTMNHYFNEKLQKLKADRLEKLLAKHVEQHYDTWQRPHVIHDVLESYYTVARKRFVDTVCMQASDFFLLAGPESPLRVFGTAFVSQLSATQLDLIVGEDVSTKQLRKSLKNEIDTLEKGKTLLRA
ncbi:dynamin [Leptodontidium sp. 2 PMI_412]|nr:dynamin [Leptodontidium sp. 2 PMI_412]